MVADGAAAGATAVASSNDQKQRGRRCCRRLVRPLSCISARTSWRLATVGGQPMGQRRHHSSRSKRRAANSQTTARAPLPVFEQKPPVVYGKPFILLEDSQKATFIFNGGQWVRHSRTIAECRQDSQVKELPQQINGMTRYEVCPPLSS